MNFFIDLEATQFSDAIISIGCVDELGNTFYSLVNTDAKINKFITDLTGITKEMCREAPDINTVCRDFYNWMTKNSMWVDNFYCYGKSDIKFIEREIRHATDRFTVYVLKKIKLHLKDCEQEISSRYKNSGTAKLIDIYNYSFNVDEKQKHNSLTDASMLKDIFTYSATHKINKEHFESYRDEVHRIEKELRMKEIQENPLNIGPDEIKQLKKRSSEEQYSYIDSIYSDIKGISVFTKKDNKLVGKFTTIKDLIDVITSHQKCKGNEIKVNKFEICNKLFSCNKGTVFYYGYRFEISRQPVITTPKIDRSDEFTDVFICSDCNSQFTFMKEDTDRVNYCPSCGHMIDMKEEIK